MTAREQDEKQPFSDSTPQVNADVDQAVTAIYDDLRRMAARFMSRERINHTLQPTALVNEAILKIRHRSDLAGIEEPRLRAALAKAMRRILVSHAKAKQARKRMGTDVMPCVVIDAADIADAAAGQFELLELHDALHALASRDARSARVAEMRIFAGSTFDEIARITGTSERTAREDWQVASAWLVKQMES